MSDTAIDRRSLIAGAGTIAALAVTPTAMAQATPTARKVMPVKPPAPLPFDAKAVGWLSEKILTSHHDNNYAGAVKRIDAIHGELAGLDYATAPGFRLAGLKREELIAWNSAALHELYFAGLTGGEKPSGKLGAALERDFGSARRRVGLGTADLERPRRAADEPMGRRPHDDARGRHPDPGARYVRTRLCDGFRGQGGCLCRRVHGRVRLGQRQPAIREGRLAPNRATIHWPSAADSLHA
jgi:hypothetical protein